MTAGNRQVLALLVAVTGMAAVIVILGSLLAPQTDRAHPPSRVTPAIVAMVPRPDAAASAPEVMTDVARSHPTDEPAAKTFSRDCPIAVPLHRGKVLWIFCDTVVTEPDGTGLGEPFTFPEGATNSAGVAEASNPTVVRNLIRADRPNTAYSLIPAVHACPVGYAANWPGSAALIPSPDSGIDRVLVFYKRVCPLTPTSAETWGAAVLAFDHETHGSAGGPTAPLQVRAGDRNDELFGDAEGTPAIQRFEHGTAEVMMCVGKKSFDDWDALGATPGCYKRQLSAVSDPLVRSSYETLSSTGTLIHDGGTPRDATILIPADAVPWDAYSLAFIPSIRRYVLIDADTFNHDHFWFRTAPTIEGPWSPPQLIAWPASAACSQDGFRTPNHCYAPMLLPFLPTGATNRVRFAYYRSTPGEDIRFGAITVEAV